MTRVPVADDATCEAFQPILELIGRRWVGVILLAGAHGARRFGQYRALITGISDRMLTQRLRELERQDLIERTVIPSSPVQILYAPTARGEQLIEALQPLLRWSLRHPDFIQR
ncbi:helix-turn-helix domain-containing protein [Actinomycetes bacterium KLBMP 9797]